MSGAEMKLILKVYIMLRFLKKGEFYLIKCDLGGRG